MAGSKFVQQTGEQEDNGRSASAEFVLNLERREELLINRIYKLSNLLSSNELQLEQEEQVKLILEDALAELEILNQQVFGKVKARYLFH